MNIGNWTRRPGKSSKWHLVESTVAGDAVTRCGRRMDRVTNRGELQVSEVMPLTRMIGQPQLCRNCDRMDAVRWIDTSEDDGSTAPTDDTP